LAAAVRSLTKEEHGAPVSLRLIAQLANAEVERVKNGSARITFRKAGNRLGCRVSVWGEILFEARLAVKSDYSDAMWHTANHRVQYCPQVAIVTEVCRTLTSGLYDNSQRQGLPERTFFNPHSLRNAVISQDEIIRCKRKDNPGGLAFHQYGHKDQIRACLERGELRTGRWLAAALRMRSIR
jgi:hypothetical protein